MKFYTTWGCPCTVILDSEGQFVRATDYFGKPLQEDQIRLPD